MVQIVGKYEHVSNSPEFEGYVKSLGGPDETWKAIVNSKPVITISQAGDQWTIKVDNAGKESVSTFKLGEPYDETMPHGITLKSVTRREGDKFIIESVAGDNRKGSRIYEFTDAGINVHLSDDKSTQTASRTYKRV